MIHCNNDGGCGMVGYGKCCGACEWQTCFVLLQTRTGKTHPIRLRFGNEDSSRQSSETIAVGLILELKLVRRAAESFTFETHQILPPPTSQINPWCEEKT